MEQEKSVKKGIKEKNAELERKTIDKIHSITNEEALQVLDAKWVFPLVKQISEMPDRILKGFTSTVDALSKKYLITMTDLETEIEQAEQNLRGELKDLTGEAHDIEGITQLARILGGQEDE